MTKKYRDLSIALLHGTNFPIMVIVGVLLGYYIGKDQGPVVAGTYALIGGMLGLAIATADLLRWSKKEAERKHK